MKSEATGRFFATWPATTLGFAQVLSAALSLYVALSLLLSYRLGSTLPCGGFGDCNVLRYHPLNSVTVIQLPDLALAASVLLISLMAFSSLRSDRFLARTLVWISLAFAIINSAMVAYARVELSVTCSWCTLSAIAFWTVAGTSALLMDRRPNVSVQGRSKYVMSLIALCAIACLLAFGTHLKGLKYGELPTTLRVDLLEALDEKDVLLSHRLIRGNGQHSKRVLLIFDPYCPTCRDLLLTLNRDWNDSDETDLYLVFAPLHKSEGNHVACAALARAREKGLFWPVVSRTGNGVSITGDDYLASLRMSMPDLSKSEEIELTNGSHSVYEGLMRDYELVSYLKVVASPIAIEWNKGEKPRRIRVEAFKLQHRISL